MERTTILAAMALVVTAGCNRAAKIDNPVAPDAPPRINLRDEPIGDPPSDGAGHVTVTDEMIKKNLEREIPVFDELAANGNDSQLQTAVYTQDAVPEKNDLGTATGVVVLVNGEPIFAEDVLEEFHNQLEAAEKQAPPEQVRKMRAQILRRRLPVHIESKLLSSALLKDLKKKQRDTLKAGLDEMFKKEITRQKAQRGITSQGEFEVALAKQGLTLQRLRQAFDERNMAQHYVARNVGTQPLFSRNELLDYYRKHQKEFAVTGKVRWQHIVVNFADQGGKSRANQVISDIRGKLIDGEEFGDLARECSDGSTAEDGGLWEWTEKGSLADEKIEATLFAIPVGTVSDIMESAGGYHLIKVIDRVDSGCQSFAEVHRKITKKLKEERFRTIANRLISELKQTAVIETDYDLDAPVEKKNDAPYAMESSVEVE